MAELAKAYVQILPSAQGIKGKLTQALSGEVASAGDVSGKNLGSGIGKAMTSGVGTAVSSMAKVAVGGFAVSTAAVAAFGKASIDTGRSFDSAMSQVASTMGMSTDQMHDLSSKQGQDFKLLSDTAQHYGATTKFTATEASEGLNYLALAGYNAKDATEMLPTVLNLASAGNMELAQASDMVTDAMSALGLSMDEGAKFTDILALTSTKTNTSVAQLGEGLLTVGGTAKSLSGGVEEASKVLGLLADNGVKASEGGTALRNIILAMNPTTKKAKEAWAELGVETYDANGNMRALSDVFQDLNKSMDGMTQQQKDKLLSNMFNKVDLKSVNALMNTNVERWDELTEAIGNAEGATAKMAETQMDNLEGKMTLLSSALDGLKLAFYNTFSEEAKDLVGGVGDAVGELADAMTNEGFAGFADKLGEIIAEGLQKFAEFAPDFLEAGAQIMFSIIGGLVEHIPDIVQTGYDTAISLIDSLTSAIAEIQPEVVQKGLESVESFASGIVDNLPQVIEKGLELVVTLSKAIADNFPQIVKTTINLIVQITRTLVSEMPKITDAGGKIIKNLVSGIVASIPYLIEGVLKLIPEAVKALWEGQQQMVDAGKNMVAGLVDGIIDGIPNVIDAMESLAQDAWDAVTDFFDINSPSRKMRDGVGRYLPEGLALGIDDEADLPLKSMDRMVNNMMDVSVPVGNAQLAGTGGMNIEITINGAKYSDERELTNKIIEEFKRELRRGR